MPESWEEHRVNPGWRSYGVGKEMETENGSQKEKLLKDVLKRMMWSF